MRRGSALRSMVSPGARFLQTRVHPCPLSPTFSGGSEHHRRRAVHGARRTTAHASVGTRPGHAGLSLLLGELHGAPTSGPGRHGDSENLATRTQRLQAGTLGTTVPGSSGLTLGTFLDSSFLSQHPKDKMGLPHKMISAWHWGAS